MSTSNITRAALSTAAGFGPSFRQVREALGLSQIACARSMQLSKNCVINMERGSDPRLGTVLSALAVVGQALRVWREAVSLDVADVAELTQLTCQIIREIEDGLSLDMAAVLHIATVYKGIAARALGAEIEREKAA